jgi:hypothetical protein
MKSKLLKSINWSILLFIALLFSCATTKTARYELEPVKVGVADTYLVKVWIYTKKTKWNKLEDQAKRNAVHGVIFRGFSGRNGISGQPALAWDKPNLETEQKEFFNNFFSNDGRFWEFADMVSDGIAAEDRVKIGRGYKIGLIVSVKKRALKDYLISASILDAMNTGF